MAREGRICWVRYPDRVEPEGCSLQIFGPRSVSLWFICPQLYSVGGEYRD